MLTNTLKRVISVTSRTTLGRIQGTAGQYSSLEYTHIQRKERELEATSLRVITFESWRQNNLELKARRRHTASSRPVWTKTVCSRGRRRGRRKMRTGSGKCI